MCLATVQVVNHILGYDGGVLGVTSVDDELFLLLEQNVNQVAVYSTDDYRLLRHLNVPRYKPDSDCDMTSFARSKCLYMSDYNRACIHRYDLATDTTRKWSVPRSSSYLSVTPSGNLLVVCRKPNKLVELSAESDGQCVREIPLQWDIMYPLHAVQLTNGQFAVCHFTDVLHQVCVVDDRGYVRGRFGGEGGSNNGQLRYPPHMALDEKSQCIFVADCHNSRIVQLSPTLEFVRHVGDEVPHPYRLHFDQTTRRLYVGVVKLIELEPW